MLLYNQVTAHLAADNNYIPICQNFLFLIFLRPPFPPGEGLGEGSCCSTTRSQHPFRTWKQIHDALTPYILRLGGKATYYKNRIAEISELFDIGEFKNDDPLSGEYLLGYYCQWQELHQWKKSDGSSLSETDDENSEE